MDKKESGHEVADKLARESLIAISYSVPDKDQSPNLLPKQLSGDHFVEAANAEKAESIRSKLISISYTQSPDLKQQSVSPGKNNG